MVSLRAVFVLEIRAGGYPDGPSTAGIARARAAKEKKANLKRVTLTGENIIDWYGRKDTARDAKERETKRSDSVAELEKERRER